jgi:predicted dienelactone hydrolase
MIRAMIFPHNQINLGQMGRWALGFTLVQVAITLSPPAAKSGHAAERISFSFGAIERSISVESLEIYVEEGRITEELAPYVSYLNNANPNALLQIRELLSQRADLDVTTVAQFAYTPQGEFLLDRVGEVFLTGARLPGGQGLRGAAIGAAADTAEGLTILNVIRRFPTPVLRVDLRQGLAIARQASTEFNQANSALSLVEQLSLQATSVPFPEGISAASLYELVSRPGMFQVSRLSLRVKSSAKPVDVYLPQSPTSRSAQRPAVVISHGLGSDRKSYAYLAEFLAARGFAVINLEHPGSSAEQLDALVSGRTNQVVPDAEFVNRPLMVSAVLDELQAIALFRDKNLGTIDFNNVGIIGQSFGGYTALAVAGAPLNLASLRNSCPPAFSIDISLLLQCQALSIGSPEQDSLSFSDPRIRAVVAINPITNAIFGPESLAQVDVPVFMISGSADTVAPTLLEQIRPFAWLSDPPAESAADENSTLENNYLLLMEGATHFSTIGITGTETFELPPAIVGPVPEIAQDYTQIMSLAFLSLYLNGDNRYQNVLTSAFTARLSQPEMPLSFVANLTSEQLETYLRRAAENPEIEQTLETLIEETERLEARLSEPSSNPLTNPMINP